MVGLRKCHGPWYSLLWFKNCRALYGAPISYWPEISIATVITYEFASRGGYIQLNGQYMGLQKCHGPWSSLL